MREKRQRLKESERLREGEKEQARNERENERNSKGGSERV